MEVIVEPCRVVRRAQCAEKWLKERWMRRLAFENQCYPLDAVGKQCEVRELIARGHKLQVISIILGCQKVRGVCVLARLGPENNSVSPSLSQNDRSVADLEET